MFTCPLGGEFKTWQLDCYFFNFEISLINLARRQQKDFSVTKKMCWSL